MHFVIGDGGLGPGPPFSSRHVQFLLTLVIFWWKFFENTALQLIPSFLYEVGIEVSGHYILRFILSPPTSIPPPPHRQIWGHLFTPQPGG